MYIEGVCVESPALENHRVLGNLVEVKVVEWDLVAWRKLHFPGQVCDHGRVGTLGLLEVDSGITIVYHKGLRPREVGVESVESPLGTEPDQPGAPDRLASSPGQKPFCWL